MRSKSWRTRLEKRARRSPNMPPQYHLSSACQVDNPDLYPVGALIANWRQRARKLTSGRTARATKARRCRWAEVFQGICPANQKTSAGRQPEGRLPPRPDSDPVRSFAFPLRSKAHSRTGSESATHNPLSMLFETSFSAHPPDTMCKGCRGHNV
jgi:hypothetical protein